MPTVFTHLAPPIAAALALGSARVPPRMLLVGMLAAVLPDLDGLAYLTQLSSSLYGSFWGHRGFTHTLGFAVLMGVLGLWLCRLWQGKPWQGFVWLMACTLSHPLLDMMTSGGAGIALFAPLSNAREFLPWRPVRVSPISASQLLSSRGAAVLLSEFQYIWMPLLLIGLSGFALRHTRISK
ncbi:metal-dependent hydrolase [Comamonas serinivorans]|uniref:Metal-dependent hydrolase n=1 Tax=Comamonas serinivorans TaxID=1082851 RepID=A0A1Y0EK59_9BURK|nr:metal-dependent hydrolase [Comamonas serinivorans]ARU03672.1 metal-dependent hydrolase [Comamonas serinivorans]